MAEEITRLDKGRLSEMRTAEELREYFKADRFVSGIGVEIISAENNAALISSKLEDRHMNALNVAQGGYLYTLADYAMGVAANQTPGVAVTMTASISYLNSPKGTTVYAEATPVKLGRSSRVYNVRVYDDLGTECCVTTFTAFVLNK